MSHDIHLLVPLLDAMGAHVWFESGLIVGCTFAECTHVERLAPDRAMSLLAARRETAGAPRTGLDKAPFWLDGIPVAPAESAPALDQPVTG